MFVRQFHWLSYPVCKVSLTYCSFWALVIFDNEIASKSLEQFESPIIHDFFNVYKKLGGKKKPVIYLPSNVYGYGYVELKTLSEFKSSKQLSQILHGLLQYFAEQDSISVSEICKKSSFSKTLKDRANVRKYLRTLLDLRLINIDQEKTNITSENVSENKILQIKRLRNLLSDRKK